MPNAVAALLVDECSRDLARVVVPSPEVHVVVRFGSSVPGGVDVHALGIRPTVHRKLVRGGQRVILARLRLGTHAAVLGSPASELAGRVVTLEDLWGRSAAQCLLDRLAGVRDVEPAARILERAIAARTTNSRRSDARLSLVTAAAQRLEHASVSAVAHQLSMSERHLRRVFSDATGLSPKTFAKLKRFGRAVEAVETTAETSWSQVAAGAGYYDQAHMIAEFRSIAGVTPRAFLTELRGQADDQLARVAVHVLDAGEWRAAEQR